MSRYTLSPPQVRALAAIAAGEVALDRERCVYVNGRTGETIGYTTLRRLRIEDMVRIDPVAITDAGKAYLATLDGAS